MANVDVETLRAAICRGDLHPRKFGLTTKIVDAELLPWMQRRDYQRPTQRKPTRTKQLRPTPANEHLDQFSVDAWLSQTSVPGQSPC
jgi:hypothetical protein